MKKLLKSPWRATEQTAHSVFRIITGTTLYTCPILSLFFMHQMAFQVSWPKPSPLPQCFSTNWLVPSFLRWTTLWWHCLEESRG